MIGLSAAALLYFAILPGQSALYARGRPGPLVLCSVMDMAVFLLALALSGGTPAIAVAWALFLGQASGALVSLLLALALSGLTLREILSPFTAPSLASLALAVGAWVTWMAADGLGDLTRLALALMAGGGVYMVLVLTLDRRLLAHIKELRSR